MKFALISLGLCGLLVTAFSMDWIHVDYTLPQDFQASKSTAATDVEMTKDGKLKLFDSASKLVSPLISTSLMPHTHDVPYK